jgi:hypothetical protein
VNRFATLTLIAALAITGCAKKPQAHSTDNDTRSASANRSKPIGKAVAERPTLHSLGMHWIVRGDDNKNAKIDLDYRAAGGEWQKGLPLFRVEKGRNIDKEFGTFLEVPKDAWLFAGSAVMLKPGTDYQVRLTLNDPDGGRAEQTLKMRTKSEPVAPNGPTYFVRPPNEGELLGGEGTKQNPYHGIRAAQIHAKPGDTFVLLPGTYSGSQTIYRSGKPGKPIVWHGSGQDQTILDGSIKPRPRASTRATTAPATREAGRPVFTTTAPTTTRPATTQPAREPRTRVEHIVHAEGVHDVWFEDMSFTKGDYAILSHNSGSLVVRRCHMYDVDYAVAATNNASDTVNDYFVTDNIMEGPTHWPRMHGIENPRGVQLTGAGHVIAYNRIRAFADAIDTMPSPRCEAIDIHNNDIYEMTDDGIETDYSQRNTRVFHNRILNAYQGITTQPVYGGPVYIWRNAMYNICVSPFKLHNEPSGVLIFHNTIVKDSYPFELWTPVPLSNSVARNNLWVGTKAGYAFSSTTPMVDCDFDYDGFAGGPFAKFMRWNGKDYLTLDDTKNGPAYRHAVLMSSDGLFANGSQPPTDEHHKYELKVDLRLSNDNGAIDKGQVLPGFNDGYQGKGPDLGAYELGSALPQFGPRK